MENKSIELVRVNAQGYDRNGRYFGATQKGERIYRIDIHGLATSYIRTTATLRQVRKMVG